MGRGGSVEWHIRGSRQGMGLGLINGQYVLDGAGKDGPGGWLALPRGVAVAVVLIVVVGVLVVGAMVWILRGPCLPKQVAIPGTPCRTTLRPSRRRVGHASGRGPAPVNIGGLGTGSNRDVTLASAPSRGSPAR